MFLDSVNYQRAAEILQRKDKDYWHDYLVDGELIFSPIDAESLL